MIGRVLFKTLTEGFIHAWCFLSSRNGSFSKDRSKNWFKWYFVLLYNYHSLIKPVYYNSIDLWRPSNVPPTANLIAHTSWVTALTAAVWLEHGSTMLCYPVPYGSLNTSRAGDEALSLSWLRVSGSRYRGEVSNCSCSWPITALEAGHDTAGNTRADDEDSRAPWETKYLWFTVNQRLLEKRNSNFITTMKTKMSSDLQVGKNAVLFVSISAPIHGEVLQAHLMETQQ